jgi:hydroxymethylbilane synthase
MPESPRLRIGTRGSALALWQAGHVRDRLAAAGHVCELRVITTTGDRVLDRRLEAVGGKGAFLKEIEEAMLAGEIDIAVHSLKDVPTSLPAGLTLVSYLERADPRDAFVCPRGATLQTLPAGARVGTTSLRRRAQLAALRSDLALVDLRGNVDTRIRKLREGQCDAIVLAMAGLERLGRRDEVAQVLEPEDMLPAPGQGVIVVECREEDGPAAQALAPLNDAVTGRAATAERVFLAALGGGCNVPLGAYAQPDGAGLWLRAFVARPDGSALIRAERRGGEPEELGRAVADDMLSRGAGELLRS